MVRENKFEEVLAIDCSSKIEKRKQGGVSLSYLSWVFAWSEFKKIYPEATYQIKKFELDNPGCSTKLVPYLYDENTGYMVNTEVTADGITYEMWLPVMDGNNKAMKSELYKYTTSKGVEKTVEQASMFDINKTIMRCLVKNLAMFGLGLHIYAGEDIPEQIVQPAETKEKKEEKNQNIAQLIRDAKTEMEMSMIYKEFKKEIAGNPSLLELCTTRGRELKGVA